MNSSIINEVIEFYQEVFEDEPRLIIKYDNNYYVMSDNLEDMSLCEIKAFDNKIIKDAPMVYSLLDDYGRKVFNEGKKIYKNY